MAEEPPYSISVRVRRTTTGYAYIAVPVSDELMQTDESGAVACDPAGFAHLDPGKVLQRALELAQSPNVRWHPEEEQIEPHPTQKAPERGEE